jgi:hypothetical protein
MIFSRTLLKELIREWAVRDLDKNLFESQFESLLSMLRIQLRYYCWQRKSKTTKQGKKASFANVKKEN